MQNETTVQPCRNCQSPLPEGAKFCPACSQKNTDGKLTVRELMAEVAGTLFNLDNRIFRTLGGLALPGKLTVDYFEGKHVRYYHPLRLFLFAGLALISITTVRFRQGESYAKMDKVVKEIENNHQKQQFYAHLDSVRLELRKELTDSVAIQAVDTFARRTDFLNVNQAGDQDSSSFNVNLLGEGVTVATKDMMELSTDSIISKYQVTGFWDRLLLTRSMRMMRGINDYLLQIFGNVIWMLLVLIPLFALCLKLAYRRRPFFYFEHVVFLMHVHAALFVLLFLLFAFAKEPPAWLSSAVSLAAIAYPLLAMKRVYRQGYLKTGLKYLLLAVAYLALAIISFVALALISFALF